MTEPTKRKRAPGGGRKVELTDGKRVNVFLDAHSLRTAEALGTGNVSRGIRRALALFRAPQNEPESS